MKKFLMAGVVLVLTGCSSPGRVQEVAPSSSSVTASAAPSPSITASEPVVTTTQEDCRTTTAVVLIPLTMTKHEHIIAHANAAVKKGWPVVLVLNREGAGERRKIAIAVLPAKPGFDRDEYPPAAGRDKNETDVAYVDSHENRSAGAVMGNALQGYCDGTKFKYALVG